MPILKKKNKPTIAVISTTCCEGCQMAILKLGPRLFELFKVVDVGEFGMLEDNPDIDAYDIAFIEGTPITKEQVEHVKKVREKTKTLVAIGTCACLGGVQQIKNFGGMKEQMVSWVYPNTQGIDNPDIVPIRKIVEVDLEIPGCPINTEEFWELAQKLVLGQIPKIPQRPVCYDCQLKENNCLLQKGLPCMGPLALGGCGAPCPSTNYPCDVCRGPLKDNNLENIKKALIGKADEKMLEMIMERFGAKDEVEENFEKETEKEK